MKILAVCHEFPPYTGGGIACHDIMAFQSLAGHEVTVFCGGFSCGGELERQDDTFAWEGAEYSTCTVLIPRDLSLSGNYRPDLLWFASMDALDAEFICVLNEFEPDVVHFFHFFQQSVRTLRELKRRGIATVCTLLDYHQFCYWMSPFQGHTMRYCHDSKAGKGCESCFAYLYLRNVPEAAWDDAVTKRYVALRRKLGFDMLRSIDRLISPSRFLPQRFAVECSDVADRIEVVHHGLHMVSSKGDSPRSGPARSFGFFGGPLVSKGFCVLLDAIALVGDSALSFHFWGPWDMKKDYGIDDPRVWFHGYVPRKGIPACYDRIDVLVQPSFTENYTTVVREAYACGAPVIAADNTGIPELVDHQTTGLLFKTGNAGDLADKIRQLAADRALYERLAETVHRLPVKSVKAEAEEYMVIYRDAVAIHRRPDVLPIDWPDMPEIRYYSMQMLSGLGREECLSHPTDSEYMDYYNGRVAYLAEDWNKAERLLLSFIERSPDPETREMLLDAGFKLCRLREIAGDTIGCKRRMAWLKRCGDPLPYDYVKGITEIRTRLADSKTN